MIAYRVLLWALVGLLLLAPPGLLSPSRGLAQGTGAVDIDDRRDQEEPSDSPDVPIARLDDRLKARAGKLYTFLEG